MKKIISLFIITLCTFIPMKAQIIISGGMGLDLVYSPSLNDYINDNFFDSKNELKTFNKSLSVFGEIDYKIDEKYQIGLEYNHSFFFHSTPLHGNYEFNYTVYKPSIIGYYVIPGDGYEFKFGGGLGFRYVSAEEKIFTTDEFTSSGIGLLVKAIGNTALGDNFYAYISADIRYDYLSEPEKDGGKITNGYSNEILNLNSLSFGIKLGVSYFID